MTINTNPGATAAALHLSRSQDMLTKSLNKLSSGSRIVQPSDDARLHLKDGDSANLTLHTIDGTIPQLRRALDRSLDAFFEFLPGATDEDRRDFDDS